MTIPFQTLRYRARLAASEGDVRACQALRHQCFFGRDGADHDGFDAKCQHMMVCDVDGRLVATARLFMIVKAQDLFNSYAAQHYDLKPLSQYTKPMIEIGRFCIAPDAMDADVLRTAWAALTQIVDARDVGMLFGCTSFLGTNPARYGQALARLRLKHLGPDALRPAIRAAHVIPFADVPAQGTDPMPPLLRTYLAMGGWVSDHAVVDNDMNTLHVFTALDVATVPAPRARALRALAQATPLA